MIVSAKPSAPKPQLLCCYLCGAQFGSQSLLIHQPQCYSKKLKEWKSNPPETRGPKPVNPEQVVHDVPESIIGNESEVEQFNKEQFKDFKQQLAACPNCGRTFFPDRLPIHMKSCKPDPSKAPPPGANAAPKKEKLMGAAAKPMLLVCCLCGQQFGSQSLAIHQPQCFKKKTEEWKRGDPATRGPKPKDPATLPQATQGNMTVDEFNQMNFEQYNSNLAACPNCGRTFNPNALAVHLRSCRPDASGKGSKPVKGKNSVPEAPPPPLPSTGQPSRPRTLICSLCGQQFGTASLKIHKPQCFKKKMLEWEKSDPATRGAPPVEPTEDSEHEFKTQEDIDTFNDHQYEAYSDARVECTQCGRKFGGVDRLAIHMKGCKGERRGATMNTKNTQVDDSSPGPPPPNLSKGRSPLFNRLTAKQVASVEGPPVDAESDDWNPLPPDDGDDDGVLQAPPKVGYTIPDGEDAEGEGDMSGLIPCGNCGRRFAEERLAKHERACTGMKARKVFDMRKQRIKGTEIAALPKGKSHAEVPKAESKWKQRHIDFQNAMKAARQVSHALATGGALPPPAPPSINPDYIQCPHCARRFAPEAAERHIPKCATTINKPKAFAKPNPKASPLPDRPKSMPGNARAPVDAAPQQNIARAQTREKPQGNPPQAHAAAATGTTRFCTSCGYKFADTAMKFCAECGTKR